MQVDIEKKEPKLEQTDIESQNSGNKLTNLKKIEKLSSELNIQTDNLAAGIVPFQGGRSCSIRLPVAELGQHDRPVADIIIGVGGDKVDALDSPSLRLTDLINAHAGGFQGIIGVERRQMERIAPIRIVRQVD